MKLYFDRGSGTAFEQNLKICFMKKLEYVSIRFLPGLFAIMLSSIGLHAQDLDKAQVHDFIQSKEFVFKAQTVMPMSGGSRQLTTEYDVRFLGDSIINFLIS